MNIKLFGSEKNISKLQNRLNLSLEDLGLTDFIKSEITRDQELKKELKIKKEPALIIEEEAIDFKDTIFEWIIPEQEELKSMLISIIWGSEGWGCGKTEDDWSCKTGCAC